MADKAGTRQFFKVPTVRLHRLQTMFSVTSRIEEDVLRCFDRSNRVRSIRPWSEIQQSQRENSYSPLMQRSLECIRWAVEDVSGRKFAIVCMTRQAFQDSHLTWSAIDSQIAQSDYELRIIFANDLPRSMVLQAEMFMPQFDTKMDPQILTKCLSILNRRSPVPLNIVVAELVEWSGKPADEIFSSLYGMLARNELLADPSTDPPMCQIGLPGTQGCLTALVLGRRPSGIELEPKVGLPENTDKQPNVLPRHVRHFLASNRGLRYRHLFSIIPNSASRITRSQAEILGKACGLSASSIYKFRKILREFDWPAITFEAIAPRLTSSRVVTTSKHLQPEVKKIIHDTVSEAYLVRAGERARISTVADLTRIIHRRCLAENLPPPCRKTVVRALHQIEALDPLKFARLRHGTNTQDKLRSRQGSYPIEVTGATLALDCTPCDVAMASDSESFQVQPRQKARRQTAKRAWMIIVKELASGVVLDADIVEWKPKARDILRVLQNVFLNTGEDSRDAGVTHWPIGRGLPRRLRLDGGSEFVNNAVRQVLETLGIEVLPRKAWNRHHGGKEERAIQVLTFMQHALQGTTLNRFYLKEPYGKMFTSSFTLADLRRYSLLGVEAYNLHSAPTFPISRLDLERNLHDLGLSAWRPLSNEQRQYIEQGMLPTKTVICKTRGIFLHGLYYQSEEIDSLIIGRRSVEIRYDPKDIRSIWLTHPNSDQIITLTPDMPVWVNCSQAIPLNIWIETNKRIKNAAEIVNNAISTGYEIARDFEKSISKASNNVPDSNKQSDMSSTLLNYPADDEDCFFISMED